ncbi:unnamed protein product [Citrullus colocynthis]|uniref:Uncharacterized protein n=1 Tax=Citrullus colocynthis TaxID=252529 RepID=A0ABP0XU03_9ROSI
MAAKLIAAWCLDVRGSMKASLLSPNVLYLVAFVVPLTEDAYGWNVPVNVVLKKPNGSKIESKISLVGKPKGEFFEVDAGELILDDHQCRDIGVIEFALYEHGCQVKKGLIMKGVVLRSKASDGCPYSDA